VQPAAALDAEHHQYGYATCRNDAWILSGDQRARRIAQLEGRVRELSMYTVASIPRGVVAYGSRVKLADADADTEPELPRTGARSTVQPTTKRQSVESSARKCRAAAFQGDA
jgi:hypothetical protein